MTEDPSQIVAIGNEVARAIGGLAPSSQSVALIVIGIVAVSWVWTRRPERSASPSAAGDGEMLKVVVAAMSEQSSSTNHLSEVVAEQSVLVARLVEEVGALVKQNNAAMDQLENCTYRDRKVA